MTRFQGREPELSWLLDLPEGARVYIKRRGSHEPAAPGLLDPRKGDFLVRLSLDTAEGVLVPVEAMAEFRKGFPDLLRPGWVWECTGVELDGLGRSTAYWMPVPFDVVLTQSTGNTSTKFTGCKVTAYHVERVIPFKWRQAAKFRSLVIPHQDAGYYCSRHPGGRHAKAYRQLLDAALEATRGTPNDC